MRKSVLIAAATISLLSACREQAVENEAESAATNDATATPAATEKAAPPAAPATKQEALKIMHDRHEGMEQIGKATKAIGQQLKAEIWQKYDDFAAKDREFRVAAQALKGSADSADMDAIKPAFADLGKACKACHDPYRAEEKKRD